jgi:hypothetical protein
VYILPQTVRWAVYTLFVADQVFAWIKRVALLNDESLKEEINLIHQSSPKAFARALSKIQRAYETFTLQDGILEQHPHAETINLLKSIGEHTIAAINANVPVNPVPYDVRLTVSSLLIIYKTSHGFPSYP